MPSPVSEPPLGSLSAPADGAPTALRIVLGTQLRRLREAQGISRDEAGQVIRASRSKISRMELGRVGFKERDIVDLAALYRLQDPDQVAELLSLMRQADTPGWWHRFGDIVPGWSEAYVGLEQAATLIRVYEALSIPELLQTEDYARAHLQLNHPTATSDRIERMTAVRMGRQSILDRADPPQVWAIVDEAALRRSLGGSQVMHDQIEHLIQLTCRSWLTLQIVPFRLGAHAGIGGPFTILRFAERDLPDIVYLEQLTSALYLDKSEDLDRYQAVMERLSIHAEEPAVTESQLRALDYRWDDIRGG